MQKSTSNTFICPLCRKKVEVKIKTQAIRCTKCHQAMVSGKSTQNTIFSQVD